MKKKTYHVSAVNIEKLGEVDIKAVSKQKAQEIYQELWDNGKIPVYTNELASFMVKEKGKEKYKVTFDGWQKKFELWIFEDGAWRTYDFYETYKAIADELDIDENIIHENKVFEA